MRSSFLSRRKRGGRQLSAGGKCNRGGCQPPDLESFKIIFTIHPGHVPLPGGASLLEFYQELQGYNPKVSIVPSCKATPFGIGTPDMVPGADLVIGTNSTVQIQAAFLGIPAIAVLLRRAFRGIELPQEPRGWWPPCDRGAIAPVYGVSSDETARLIATLLTAEGSAPMRAAQKRFFPPFKKVGQAFERMGEAIRNLEPLNAYLASPRDSGLFYVLFGIFIFV